MNKSYRSIKISPETVGKLINWASKDWTQVRGNSHSTNLHGLAFNGKLLQQTFLYFNILE